MQLLLVLSLLFVSLALGSPSDVLYIEKLDADSVQLPDAKNFAGLVNIYTQNATYIPDTGPRIRGIVAIQAFLSKIFPNGTITQHVISTESITLLGPFDEQGAAGTATGVVYSTTVYIGQGNLTGQAYTAFGKYVDKYVKTADFARHGGWRISERAFLPFVSCLQTDLLNYRRLGGARVIDLAIRFSSSLMKTDPLIFSIFLGQARWQSKNPSGIGSRYSGDRAAAVK